MKSTRIRILEYLQQKQTATTSELSHVVGCTAANIRHHLHILLSEGVIKVAGTRRTHKRGRPVMIYQLEEHAVQSNITAFIDALIEVFIRSQPVEKHPTLLRMIALQILSTKTEFQIPRTIPGKLIHAIQLLNDLNYKARWEARHHAPVIIFGHCPYRQIVEKHPELCMLDQQILELLIQSNISQAAKLDPDISGLPQCIFNLENKQLLLRVNL